MAENTGEIGEIGRWVLNKVCAQLHTWNELGIHQQRWVSWNVSPRQLAQDNFVDEVLSTLTSWGIDRDRVVLEVTESTVFEDDGSAEERLIQLRDAGIRVAIDDFGSGHSNLGKLLQVPFDVLKIDRSLMLTLTGAQPSARAEAPGSILSAIVSIAEVFGVPVVCEGVETEDQRQLLEMAGITHVQGYLTGRPVPPEDLDEGRPATTTSTMTNDPMTNDPCLSSDDQEVLAMTPAAGL